MFSTSGRYPSDVFSGFPSGVWRWVPSAACPALSSAVNPGCGSANPAAPAACPVPSAALFGPSFAAAPSPERLTVTPAARAAPGRGPRSRIRGRNARGCPLCVRRPLRPPRRAAMSGHRRRQCRPVPPTAAFWLSRRAGSPLRFRPCPPRRRIPGRGAR